MVEFIMPPVYIIKNTKKNHPFNNIMDDFYKSDDLWWATTVFIMLWVYVCIKEPWKKASPFIIRLLLDFCLDLSSDLGSDLLQVHWRLGWLTFLLCRALSAALFQMGKSDQPWRPLHHNTVALSHKRPSEVLSVTVHHRHHTPSHKDGEYKEKKRSWHIC